ncbi:MAG: hypothetical protein QF570_08595 [Myxococcota bacterium]|jgi:hypothetical protein|nr:hypothetical protein [Myxococcota bacterium]
MKTHPAQGDGLYTPSANASDLATRATLRGLLVLACLLSAFACDGRPGAVAWPDGHWVVGDRAALSPVISGFAEFESTPAGRFAARWSEAVEGCDDFVMRASAEDGLETLLGNVVCADSLEVPHVLTEHRGDAAAVFSFASTGGTRSHGRVTIAPDGSHQIDARFEPSHDAAGAGGSSLHSLLVQGDEAAGPAALSSEDAVIHARIRPAGGIDLASLVSQGSQADQMFNLRSELFMGALLKGAWEVALYLPRHDQVTPPMVLSLDHTIRVGAERAMQTFVSGLEATWPIHHSEQDIAGHAGTCFHDLKLLPDLVPCYVVTERSIVVGWNPTSIALALGRTATPATYVSGPVLDEQGGLLVHLDRLPEADARLQRQLHGARPATSLASQFDRLRVDARSASDSVSLRIELERDARLGATP